MKVKLECVAIGTKEYSIHHMFDSPKNVEDDIREPLVRIIRNRLPWLILGLFWGIVTSFFVAHFEKVLEADIRLSFFIPIIVYMSDAVGTQTETIYVRHLQRKCSDFKSYFMKEISIGISLGVIFGCSVGLFAYLWLWSPSIALTVGLAMGINVFLAPILAILLPSLLYRDHLDPALGAGPLCTVAQDFISLMVYFMVASMIIIF